MLPRCSTASSGRRAATSVGHPAGHDGRARVRRTDHERESRIRADRRVGHGPSVSSADHAQTDRPTPPRGGRRLTDRPVRPLRAGPYRRRYRRWPGCPGRRCARAGQPRHRARCGGRADGRRVAPGSPSDGARRTPERPVRRGRGRVPAARARRAGRSRGGPAAVGFAPPRGARPRPACDGRSRLARGTARYARRTRLDRAARPVGRPARDGLSIGSAWPTGGGPPGSSSRSSGSPIPARSPPPARRGPGDSARRMVTVDG